MAQIIKNLPVMKETWTQLPGQDNPREKGMANHASILTWRIPQTQEPGGTVHGVTKSWTQLSN